MGVSLVPAIEQAERWKEAAASLERNAHRILSDGIVTRRSASNCRGSMRLSASRSET